jgi:phenylpropionate dioxygenase-like ring-hydroxylating dioxygenase large terminal subunit
MEHRCPQRCASLFFGRNEEGGLRCIYHGWKFDVEGNCLDMPNVPAAQDFKHRIKAKAYKVVERSGFVWTYMGAAREAPRLPNVEDQMLPEEERFTRVHHARVQLVPVARRRHRHLALRLPACRRRRKRRRLSRRL